MRIRDEDYVEVAKETVKKAPSNFMNGIIVLAPIAITIFVVKTLLDITEGFGILIPQYFPEIKYFPGLGLISILIFIFVIGWIFSFGAMKYVLRFGEWFLGKIPFVKFIYYSVKQFSKAVFESDSMFEKVVLVPYHQSKAIGFLMSDPPKFLRDQIGHDYVCVFVPWSLNMTSGTNIFVKRSDVVYLDIDSKSALQYMLTAGTVMPTPTKKKIDADETYIQNS